MRKLNIVLLVALVLLPLVAGAQSRIGYPELQQQMDQFSYLARQTYYSLNTASAACPVDTTYTNCATTAYIGSSINAPYKIRIQNLGANKIYYNPQTVSGTTLTAPDTEDSYLVSGMESATGSAELSSGEAVELFFVSQPNMVLGGGGSAATFTVEVWTR